MVEYTLHSRTRRAMTCVYCEPKSNMTICSVMEKPEAQCVPLNGCFGERKSAGVRLLRFATAGRRFGLDPSLAFLRSPDRRKHGPALTGWAFSRLAADRVRPQNLPASERMPRRLNPRIRFTGDRFTVA